MGYVRIVENIQILYVLLKLVFLNNIKHYLAENRKHSRDVYNIEIGSFDRYQ